jgi:hypothetical protein
MVLGSGVLLVSPVRTWSLGVLGRGRGRFGTRGARVWCFTI